MLVEERDMIAVKPMDEEHALALFEKKLVTAKERLGSQADKKDVAELAKELEYIPLAIVQATAYISQRASRCSVRQYLEEFRKSDRKRTSLLNHGGGQLRRDREAKNSIIITWQISFDYLLQTRRSAADLLSLMSFFDSQGIPESLLRNRIEEGNAQLDQNRDSGDNGDDEEDSDSQSTKSDEFEEDVLVLQNYSFISINTDGTTFEMHRLVQLATRTWLAATGQLEKWKQQYIKNLDTEFPTGKFENWAKCQELFPHAKSAAEQRPEEQESLIEWASVLYKAAWYAWRKGDGAEGEKISVKAMKTRRRLLGQEDEQTLSSIAMVGLIYSLEGRWKEAEELFVQVVETRKRVLGAEHLDTLTSMNNLAETYRNQGRWKEAEELFVQVMETRKRVLGAEHPSTLTIMNNLAETYRNQGRWKEAEELEVQVVETQ
jgi:tetratricopeptide (TPR) repeat protein